VLEGREFKPSDKVFVIDPNGDDIWEAVVLSVRGGKYSVHFPEYPEEDQDLGGTGRILADTRTNHRIFKERQQRQRMDLRPWVQEREGRESEAAAKIHPRESQSAGFQKVARLTEKDGSFERAKDDTFVNT
jgi:hypothetical protein